MTASSATTNGQGILPAPAFRRAGDFVFVSSLYPVDDSGAVVRSESISPYLGESEMGAQSRRVLELLRGVLDSAGSSLDRVLRVEAYLADAADFHEFKLVWMELFPADPPARTTIVVGDEHAIPGCRLNLHAVALAGDAAVERESILVEGIPNPIEAEHTVHAVKAAPFLFPSAFPATDFETGIPVGKRPNFPAYGSDPEAQTHYVMQNLSRVAEAAGTSVEQILKTQFYETDFLNFHYVDAVWGSYVGTPPDGVPPARSSMGCRGFLYPGALFATNTMILVPDDDHRKTETREGIRWHPEDVRKVHYSPGVWGGDWLFLAGQISMTDYGDFDSIVRAPAGAPHTSSDIEVQTEFVMTLLGEQLTGNGLELADIVDARIFLVDTARRDYRGFVRAWERLFESVERRPSMSLIPSTTADGGSGVMIPDLLVEIDLIARRGG